MSENFHTPKYLPAIFDGILSPPLNCGLILWKALQNECLQTRKTVKICKLQSYKSLLALSLLVCLRVSNGTGQYNFSGQRDRSFFIVPGQKDNGTSSKSCQGMGRAGTAKIWDRTGRDSQNPGRDVGQNGTERKWMI